MDFLDRIFSRIFGIHLHSSSSAVRALTRPAKLDSFDPLPQVLQFSLRCRPWGRGGEGRGREEGTKLATTVAHLLVGVLATVIAFRRLSLAITFLTLSAHLLQMSNLAADATLFVAHPACRLLMAISGTASTR